jgi:hypothetical protein
MPHIRNQDIRNNPARHNKCTSHNLKCNQSLQTKNIPLNPLPRHLKHGPFIMVFAPVVIPAVHVVSAVGVPASFLAKLAPVSKIHISQGHSYPVVRDLVVDMRQL